MSRIVILSPAHPFRGGIAQFTHSLAAALRSGSHDVSLASYLRQYPACLFPGTTQFSKDPPPPELAGIDVRHTIDSVNPLSWFRTAQWIAKSQPDILLIAYIHPFFAFSSGWIAHHVRLHSPRTRILVLAHDIQPYQYGFFSRTLSRLLFRESHGFIALSRHVSEELHRLEPGKSVLQGYHPPYTSFGARIPREQARGELGLEQGKEYLLFFGLIRPYKRLDLLLHAFAHPCLRERQSLRLLIAGENYTSMEPYRRIIRMHDLADRIIERNEFIPHEEVRRYFSAADLLVQPYNYVSQSGVTSTALHFDLPAVVTNIGGLQEYVDHGRTGYIVDQSPEAIAEAILDFLERKRGMEFSRNIAAFKEQFSWHALAENIARFAQSLRA